MARILVIGRSGQVARALAAAGRADVHCAGRDEADLLDKDRLARALERHQPDIVLNAGAYTSVDGAETEQDQCRALNVRGPENLAQVCAARDLPLIHLSTDCVFDGEKTEPYTPDDPVNPLGVYGQSKLEGERGVRVIAPRSVVVRVTWIFSRHGSNFVSTMLRVAKTRERVTVVNDQVGCPTYAPALADALLNMAEKVVVPGFDAWGVYHVAGAGETDRASMAREIYALSGDYGGPVAEVVSVPTSAYPTPAARPLNARLDMSDTTRIFGVTMPDWREGLLETVPVLVGELEA